MRRLLILLLVLPAYGQIRDGTLRSATVRDTIPPQPAACTALNDSSLKGYWKLDEGSGDATDSKGANTLVDNNSVGTAAGVVSSARHFTSFITPSFLSIVDNTDLSMGDIDFTIGAWVYYDGTLSGCGCSGTIMGKFTAGSTIEYGLELTSVPARYQFFVSNDGTSQTTIPATSFGVPADNTWHYVVAWHDATANTINIQIDNSTVDSTAHTTGVFDSTNSFRLSQKTAATGWKGQIDEAFVTKRVLTSGERTALYNAGAACRPSGL